MQEILENENQQAETPTQEQTQSSTTSFAVIAAEVESAKKLALLYPLDWKTTEVRMAGGRYVHTIERPSSELILERESEINQDIAIDKKGGYLLPDPTDIEEIDAKIYDRLNPATTGYSGKVPELHKSTVLQSLFERNIYVDENCDVFGDEIVVIEEICNGLEVDFVIKHFLRGADETEVKKFRRKNANRKIERDRRGRQTLMQSSQLRPAMDFYESLFTGMDGVKIGDQPYSDERRADFLANVNPLIQRAVVKAYIEELTGNLLD